MKHQPAKKRKAPQLLDAFKSGGMAKFMAKKNSPGNKVSCFSMFATKNAVVDAIGVDEGTAYNESTEKEHRQMT